MVNCIVTKLFEGLWKLSEIDPENPGSQVDAYFVCGTEKGVLIDTLQSEVNLVGVIREITDLPVEVLITHAHPDHAGAEVKNLIAAGYKVHMNHEDLQSANTMFMGYDPNDYLDIYDGEKYDLGGVTLETLILPGHTPASVVFLDRKKGWLFSGDAIGSGGFWLQLPNSTTMGEFFNSLQRLEGIIADIANLKILCGHTNQSPMPLQNGHVYIQDLHELITGIQDGKLVGESVNMKLGPMELNARRIHYKSIAELMYDPKKV